jgi:hypothetical protein
VLLAKIVQSMSWCDLPAHRNSSPWRMYSATSQQLQWCEERVVQVKDADESDQTNRGVYAQTNTKKNKASKESFHSAVSQNLHLSLKGRSPDFK